MNRTEIALKIPLGYRIIEKNEEVDLFTACDILRSGKQKYISCAKRVGDRAILTTHHIKCPHCGKEIPAYAHYCCKSFSAFPKKSEIEISAWAEIQLTMIDEPNEKLYVQDVYDYSEEYICEKCGYNSLKSQNYADLLLNYIDGSLYIRREIKNLAELLSFKWLNGVANISFPLYEQLVFDFGTGSAEIELLTADSIVCTATVNGSQTNFAEDVLVQLLTKNRVLKRTIKRLFEEISGEKIPFTTKELDFDKFITLLRFRGFSKDFYEAIPFWKGTRVLDASFNAITEKLKNPQMAMELLKEADIPFCKSVKRLFVKNSGLFFYLRECEFLFSVFKDVNLFCTFLDKPRIIQFLSMMHYYEPSVKAFLTDYSRVLGKERFSKKISASDRFINYGAYYASLSTYVQQKEQEKWLDGIDLFDDFRFISYHGIDISVPLSSAFKNTSECVVDKFRFKFLRTKVECVIAGERMKNCLVNWDAYSNPVAVIYSGDKMVGAVEVSDDTLVQAKESENKSIVPDSDLYNAIQKWCQRKNIMFNPDDLEGPFMRE